MTEPADTTSPEPRASDLWLYEPRRGYACCGKDRNGDECGRLAPYVRLRSHRGSLVVFAPNGYGLCRTHFGKRNAPAKRKAKK